MLPGRTRNTCSDGSSGGASRLSLAAWCANAGMHTSDQTVQLQHIRLPAVVILQKYSPTSAKHSIHSKSVRRNILTAAYQSWGKVSTVTI
eukprot:6201626-Pleurochrysis_carterae.AAC.1